MGDQHKHLGKKIIIWAGSITAVLTLIFGVQKLYSQITTTIEAKKEVEDLIQISRIKVDVGDYVQAWEILTRAEQFDVMEYDIEMEKAVAAMYWLQNMRGNDAVGTFTDQTERILVVLSKAATRAEGEFLADIYAHMGWADLLRYKEGNSSLDPQKYYEKALSIDPDNTYANAMLGHWLSRSHRDPEKGWEHLQIAANTGKYLEYTRGMQFAALGYVGYGNSNFLNLLHDMRLKDESIDDDVVSRILSTNYYGSGGFGRFIDALRTGEPVKSPIPPEDDLALIEWLWNKYPHIVQNYHKFKPYIVAILTEASGDNSSAHEMYKTLQKGLPENNPSYYSIDEYMQNAVDRTSSSQL